MKQDTKHKLNTPLSLETKSVQIGTKQASLPLSLDKHSCTIGSQSYNKKYK